MKFGVHLALKAIKNIVIVLGSIWQCIWCHGNEKDMLLRAVVTQELAPNAQKRVNGAQAIVTQRFRYRRRNADTWDLRVKSFPAAFGSSVLSCLHLACPKPSVDDCFFFGWRLVNIWDGELHLKSR